MSAGNERNPKKPQQVNIKQASRREFLKRSVGAFGAMTLSSFAYGAVSGWRPVQKYPVGPAVFTTLQRMISFPKTLPGLTPPQLREVEQYSKFGYGNWTFGSPLPLIPRTDLLPASDNRASTSRKAKFLHFFAFSDIHITDKEAPNQLIHFQQAEPFFQTNMSIYSPVMAYSTHVLDAAIQTVNVLHKQNRFDFGISLGDTCNNTSYNELRWYLDVIDGKRITPSSGAHLGADHIDYQKPFQAVGLDKSIPWYQTMGNHDHLYLGSFPVDAHPALGFRQAYVADTVWALADFLIPNLHTFPVMFDISGMTAMPQYFGGLVDGSSPFGKVIYTGLTTDASFAEGVPKVAPDPDRRSLIRTEWKQEFFKTTTQPAGHGFHLVDKNSPPGFACYSFIPNPKIPLKIIVLDNTQREDDGSTDIHGHGYLDSDRWSWLQAELAKGQADDQLMIIAAHIPIAVAPIGSELEWWGETKGISPQHQNAVDLAELVKTLQSTPNLLMWMAGHLHLNTVKAFPSTDPTKPEQGFWQVETSSLRDFPQQFRTFEIFLNDDNTVSIVTINVDPAVVEGTPAATSRKYAIAVQQIIQRDMRRNHPNYLTFGGTGKLAVPSMDPTRPQSDDQHVIDPNIHYVDLSNAEVPVPCHGSYNAELFVQLSPHMASVLRSQFR